eukprot:SAG11_NODE_5488_length_1547_cov_2.321823_1_plen_147_part_00
MMTSEPDEDEDELVDFSDFLSQPTAVEGLESGDSAGVVAEEVVCDAARVSPNGATGDFSLDRAASPSAAAPKQLFWPRKELIADGPSAVTIGAMRVGQRCALRTTMATHTFHPALAAPLRSINLRCQLAQAPLCSAATSAPTAPGR